MRCLYRARTVIAGGVVLAGWAVEARLQNGSRRVLPHFGKRVAKGDWTADEPSSAGRQLTRPRSLVHCAGQASLTMRRARIRASARPARVLGLETSRRREAWMPAFWAWQRVEGRSPCASAPARAPGARAAPGAPRGVARSGLRRDVLYDRRMDTVREAGPRGHRAWGGGARDARTEIAERRQ